MPACVIVSGASSCRVPSQNFVDCGAKVIAAFFVAGELVETCAGGRQQDHVSRVGLLLRMADSLLDRPAVSCRSLSLEDAFECVGGFADEQDFSHPPPARGGEWPKVEILVAPTRNPDYGSGKGFE